MARIRYLKPDFFKDEHLKDLPFEARLLYAGLWCWADKEGRLEDRPERIKVEIFPYDKVDIDKLLTLLASPKNGSNRPYIQRYEVNNEKYIQILNWHKHQRPHHTEQESKIPPAPPLLNIEKGMGKQHEASTELRNGERTVKQPLPSHPPYVFLTTEEYQNLNTLYTNNIIKDYIERLNDYAGQFPTKFKRYASHYATIRNWMRRDNVKKLPPKLKEDKPKEVLRYDPRVTELIKATTSELKGKK